MSAGYLQELESMARAAREKGQPSAEVFDQVAKAWPVDCADATLDEQREVFDFTVEVAHQLDGAR